MNSDCIFCRIVAGELPCTKVYEDAEIMAFLDIGPIIKGHTLVIPKQHFDPLVNTPDETLNRLIAVVKRIARAQTEGLGASGINVTQANGRSAGQVVPHVHFHVIPRFDSDGHSWNWRSRKYDAPAEMEQYATKLRSALK